MTRPPRPAPPDYVDTPAGLLSAGGQHFRTTEALLRSFAAPVVERVGVGPLVRAADAWAEAPRAAAALVLVAALGLASPSTAVGLALLAWIGVALAAPGVATLRLAPAWRAAGSAAVQGLVFALGLSALAAAGALAAVGVGLAGFAALRLGLVAAALRPLVGRLHGRLYALPPPDQTLRSLVVRAAIRDGVSLPALADMEARARAFWQRDGDRA